MLSCSWIAHIILGCSYGGRLSKKNGDQREPSTLREKNLKNLTKPIRVRSMRKSLWGLTRWSPKLVNLIDSKFLPQHTQPHFKLTANVSKNSNPTQRAPPKSPSCRSMNDCHSPKVIVPDPTTLMTSNTRCGLRHIATNWTREVNGINHVPKVNQIEEPNKQAAKGGKRKQLG